ncbi:DegT/DnrJ/EryC1/StrS family aminotransferase [Patescibacteria group bacterium]|nr:DegT/DnrJ/EryC1/StrS family aminotransferase [Patescibacteria group bacterium]
MKFIDIVEQDAHLKEEIAAAILEVISRGDFILGKEVEELEKKLQEYFGVRHAILVSSGTDALLLALRSLNLPKRGEIITTPFTFFATSEAIINEGLVPVYIDIDPNSFNIDPNKIEAAITERTCAILPVHLFGKPARMDIITEIAKRNNLKVVEDCAQAFGATLQNKAVGTWGKVGCFSFYPTKNLGAYGDAGLIITNDDKTAQRLKILRDQGANAPYRHKEHGLNARCDTLQAAILLKKLPHVSELNDRRRHLAARYTAALSCHKDLDLPVTADDENHVFHQYTIQVPAHTRDDFRTCLYENAIPSAVYYDLPLHRQQATKPFAVIPEELRNSEIASHRVVSLPIYPTLRDQEIDQVVDVIRTYYPN